jgi:TRAP-type C4-dicarboxylate transport system permease small subunit
MVIKKYLEYFLEFMSSLFFVGLVAVVLLQVYARMFLPRSPHWTEEASRFLMIYMVAFAAGIAAKERAYVNVDTFINYAKGRPRIMLQLLIDVIVVVLMAATCWYGWKNAAVGRIQTSASLGIPMIWIYGAMSLHAGGIVVYTIPLILEDIKNFISGEANYGDATFS